MRDPLWQLATLPSERAMPASRAWRPAAGGGVAYEQGEGPLCIPRWMRREP